MTPSSTHKIIWRPQWVSFLITNTNVTSVANVSIKATVAQLCQTSCRSCLTSTCSHVQNSHAYSQNTEHCLKMGRQHNYSRPIVWLYAQLTLESPQCWAAGLIQLYLNQCLKSAHSNQLLLHWIQTVGDSLLWSVKQKRSVWLECLHIQRPRSNTHMTKQSNTCELLLHTSSATERRRGGRFNHTYADFLMPRA